MTRRGAILLTVVSAWTALALLFGVTNALTYMSTGRPPRWGLSLGMALADWWVWAILTLPVLWLAGRFPIDRSTLARNIPVHLAAALAAAALKVAIDRWVRRALFGFPVSYFLISNLAPQFAIYWAIVGSAHGWTYYHRSRERELQASQPEARLAEARLQLLQMQLQPHFLFNTLHAISELVHEDPETADRMIGGLSDLLREALDTDGIREVPLERELQLLNRYLEIQAARFGDRLRIVMDVDEDVRAVPVPSLILQPLVENAIRHGLASRAEAGRIDIRAARNGERLVIEVADDGIGIEPSGVLQEGVGLGNTRARLQELYADRHSLDIRRNTAGGVSVLMVLPIARAAGRAAV